MNARRIHCLGLEASIIVAIIIPATIAIVPIIIAVVVAII
jgi:hypothetical protein